MCDDYVDQYADLHQVTAVDSSLAQALPAQFFAHLQQQACGAQQHNQVADAAAAVQHNEGMDVQQNAELAKKGLEPMGVAPDSENVPTSGEDRGMVDAVSILEALASKAEGGAGDQSPDSKWHKTPSTAAQSLNHPTPSAVSVPRVQTVQPMVSSDGPPKTSTSAFAGTQGKGGHSDSVKMRLAAKAGERSSLDPSHPSLHSAVNEECSSGEVHGSVTGGRRRVVKRGLEERCSSRAPGKGKLSGGSDSQSVFTHRSLNHVCPPFLFLSILQLYSHIEHQLISLFLMGYDSSRSDPPLNKN